MNINDPLRNAGMKSNSIYSQTPSNTKSQAPAIKCADRVMREPPPQISNRDNTKYSGNVKNYLPDTLQIKNDNSHTKILKGVLVTLGSPIILPCLASHAVVVAVGNAQNVSIAKDANQLLDKKDTLISQINHYKAFKATYEQDIKTYTNIISDRREEFGKLVYKLLESGKVFDYHFNHESTVLTNYHLKTEIHFVELLNEEKANLSALNAKIKSLEDRLEKINDKLDAISVKNVKLTKIIE